MRSTSSALREVSQPSAVQRVGTVILGPFPRAHTSPAIHVPGLDRETWHGQGKQAYRAGLASTHQHKAHALDFVRKNYREAGYHEPESLAPTSSESVTAIAQRGNSVIGTISLWRDGDVGLQADEIFAPELNRLRQRGAILGEFGRLAFDKQTPFLPLLTALVGKIAHAGCLHWHLTDFLIECNPRHVGFYTRLLGFTVMGDTRNCSQVGAPAVLLHLEAQRLGALASQADIAPVARRLRSNVYSFDSSRKIHNSDRQLALA